MSNSATSTAPVTRDAAAIGSVVITILIWASAFPAIRAGLASFGPIELGALRFAIAGVPAALYLLITRPGWPKGGEVWRILTGGIFFVALYTVLLNIGEQTVSAGPASFIINVNPIITAIFAMLLLNETFGRWAWVGTAVSFAGIGLIAFGEGEGLSLNMGALFIFGAALCNTVTTIAQKPLFKTHKPVTVAAWNIVIGTLILMPAMPSALAQIPAASNEAIFSVIYLGIGPSMIAYATYSIMLSKFPASRASNFLYSVPPISTLLGFLWLGEVPGLLAILGGLMALAGVVMVNIAK
ncbi:DMT family transporter [Aestuariivirga sp. YIM B02566]|uniref:DMT family transporter n=1 Tax=Taklimakanibacter albus TaxID=2800327 RepID=A0ACC5QY03_9HYPH|nr:DMT family transporter [Aestuariivirga sp. YIM B02566]MBK1865058.1 DMT family transporter [Aestuariivirga sp. YIM B02566]